MQPKQENERNKQQKTHTHLLTLAYKIQMKVGKKHAELKTNEME